ncbi:hypothetical protein NDU88_006030 [Pleurodeles waltl]|uniref:Uncharacterized protein n=1 Tax=Pleurodeles waltl TaxID=8319 RepID=A0AAV7QMU4_PLEWA|nr:hypothetical protein NDU88_006030 [Pleurodeles waltl]
MEARSTRRVTPRGAHGNRDLPATGQFIENARRSVSLLLSGAGQGVSHRSLSSASPGGGEAAHTSADTTPGGRFLSLRPGASRALSGRRTTSVGRFLPCRRPTPQFR